MKVTGFIKEVLPEREVTTSSGTLRKKDFIISVAKPQQAMDADRTPDTIALTLIGDHIDRYPISVGDHKTCLYDCNARISAGGNGNEAISRTSVFRMYEEE